MEKLAAMITLLALTGCSSVLAPPTDLPEGASYIGCANVDLHGNFSEAEGFRCTKIGDGFDNVDSITTPAGTVEFKKGQD